ncbi:MAG: asparagine synthase (glutamine-hydrolyzing) [bacterium]|nr:asparagine synthase (glutamine-hydrolyzing) [bacterium]
MCGISGIINIDNKPVNSVILTEMNNAQSHRGPDGEGLKIIRNVGLAHKRLSIIDINAGYQPLSNENGEIWITYNGEIYNHVLLKENLIKKGHVFKTNCDTEVIIHLYEEYGIECLNLIDGMFAFAIYDIPNRKLFLVRDRMGQKPLSYYFKNKLFLFSSELQAIVKHPNIEKEINDQSFHDYLTLQYIPAPNTIYKDIYKLSPAHYLELNLNKSTIVLKKYWQCSFNNKLKMKYEEASENLKFLLKESVSKRLMSDVPLGTFLSGGIDSTIITSIAAGLKDEPIESFTIGFENNKFDERKYARIAAEKYNTIHHELLVDPSDFNILNKLVPHYGEPYSDASMIPTYYLSKFAGKKITVALSGDGADELFAGYYRYLVFRNLSYCDSIPHNIRKFIHYCINKMTAKGADERTFLGKLNRITSALASHKDNRYLNILSRCSDNQKHYIYGEKILGGNLIQTNKLFSQIINKSKAANSVEKIMETDLQTYLNGDILTKVDIASMANSLELRSPFMDHKIVEFAASLPLAYKQKFNSRKHILKNAFKDDIPNSLRHRSKMGFGVPISNWLRKKWKTESTDLLMNGNSIKGGYIKRSSVANLLWEHQTYRNDHSYLIWSLIIFEIWYSKFIS